MIGGYTDRYTHMYPAIIIMLHVLVAVGMFIEPFLNNDRRDIRTNTQTDGKD
jgi:hypothetical protein